jgi:hypothetical protein
MSSMSGNLELGDCSRDNIRPGEVYGDVTGREALSKSGILSTGKLKKFGEDVLQWHIVEHVSHIKSPRIHPSAPWYEANR